jgi:hypothetical protein
MRKRHGLGACLLTVTALGFLAGCEGSPPAVDTTNTEATVKGVVKIDGVPATEGEVMFDPANYRRKDAAMRTAPIGADGSYTVKTLTGENQVKLGGSLVHKKGILGRVTRGLDVKPGENTFDFEASAK